MDRRFGRCLGILGNGKFSLRLVEKDADLKDVLAELKSSDKSRRFDAIRAMEWPQKWAKADSKALVEAMGERLKDEYLPVRYRAGQALKFVGPDAAAVLPALIKATEDDERYIKVDAIGAIANIGPPAKSAIPALAKQLEFDDKFVPMHAAHALANIGEAAIPALVEGLKSKRTETRSEVIEALASMGTTAESAIPALKAISTDDDMFLRFRIRYAIEQIGRPASEQPPFWVYGERQKPQERERKKQKGE